MKKYILIVLLASYSNLIFSEDLTAFGCGKDNAGTCMSGNGMCPSDFNRVWGGDDCESGKYCCKAAATVPSNYWDPVNHDGTDYIKNSSKAGPSSPCEKNIAGACRTEGRIIKRNSKKLEKQNSNTNCPEGTIFCGPGVKGGADFAEKNLTASISKEHNLKKLIIGWVRFLLGVTAVLAVVAFVWAGVLYVTALGDDGRMESAKKIIIWVIIGILVILGSYAIVNTIMQANFS